jgi:hypothetical protein
MRSIIGSSYYKPARRLCQSLYLNAMTRKGTILSAIILTTIFVEIVLFILGKKVFPVIFLGALATFIVFGAYTPPKKHKASGIGTSKGL